MAEEDNSPKNPFEAMMEAAGNWAQAMNPAMKEFMPENVEKFWPVMGLEAMEASFGKGLNPNGLDSKTRLWLTLAGLVIQGAQNETALRMTVRHLAEAKASRQEISEAIGMLAVFAGVPAMTKAQSLADEALGEEK